MRHANIDCDPNEQINLRYRLYTRAIKVKGLAQMDTLYPYLQTRLNQTIAQQLDAQFDSDGRRILICLYHVHQLMRSSGWTCIQIAPVMRQCATGLLGVYMFGNTLCKPHLFF